MGICIYLDGNRHTRTSFIKLQCLLIVGDSRLVVSMLNSGLKIVSRNSDLDCAPMGLSLEDDPLVAGR